MSKEKFRSRSHMLLLYPDNAQHCDAVEKIKQSYDYALILHNRDYWTPEDELKNSEHIAGELKKEHWHIVLRFPQAKWNTALSNELGIELKFIEEVKKFDNALQYLIHYNDSDKAVYSIDEVKGNLKKRLAESINKQEKSEGEKVSELIEFIKSCNHKLSVGGFASYCANEGYWSEFRRSASIFIRIIDEHNMRFENKIQ